MKHARRFTAVSLLLVLAASTGFGWGNATHTYYSNQLGAHNGPPNLNEMYGAVLVDAFNLVLVQKGQFLSDQFHHNPQAIISAALSCEKRAAAFGFASHNDNWGADWTAHHDAQTLPGGGYAVLKGQELASTLTPVLYRILRNADPPVPEQLAEGLAYSLAPELGHDLAETAVDLMIRKWEDPMVGGRMVLAAQSRHSSIPDLLCSAYGPLLAAAFGISVEDADAFIIAGEAEYRNQMMQYGQAFLLPEGRTIRLLAEMNAAIAEGYLEFFAAEYGFVADITVSPATVEKFLHAAINLVKRDYMQEVDATLAYVGNQLEQRGVLPCDPFGKEGDFAANSAVAPAKFTLGENFPNPFNPSTTISFRIPSTAVVSLDVYNIVGQKVRTLINANAYEPGSWDVVWNGVDDAGLAVPSGVYFSRMTTPNGVLARKMQLIK